MRVPANTIERILIAAQDAATADRQDQRHSSEYSDLVAAFERAGELRDKPLGRKVVRGRKSGVKQFVITTNLTNGDYTLCLLAYAGTSTLRYLAVKTVDGRQREHLYDSNIIPGFREQWIRTDRLEAPW